jgi:hypothetical protein
MKPTFTFSCANAGDASWARACGGLDALVARALVFY